MPVKHFKGPACDFSIVTGAFNWSTLTGGTETAIGDIMDGEAVVPSEEATPQKTTRGAIHLNQSGMVSIPALDLDSAGVAAARTAMASGDKIWIGYHDITKRKFFFGGENGVNPIVFTKHASGDSAGVVVVKAEIKGHVFEDFVAEAP